LLVYDWPAVCVIALFEGTTASVRMNGNRSHFNVLINKRLVTVLETDKMMRRYPLVKGLPDGVYELRIEKRTEPQWNHGCSSSGPVQVDSLVLDMDRGLRRAPPRMSRKIECVGNVATAYQVESPGTECFASIIHQNAMCSYATVLARALQAEPHIVACTSKRFVPQRCLCRCLSAMCCMDSAHTFADLYPRAVSTDSSAALQVGDWAADVVLIVQGYNHALPGCSPSVDQIQQGYLALYAAVRRVHAAAHIMCIALDWETMPQRVGSLGQHKDICDRMNTAMRAAADAFDDPSVQCIHLQMPSHLRLEFPDDWAAGSYWAPSGHQKVGEALVPHVASALNWPLCDVGMRTPASVEEVKAPAPRRTPTRVIGTLPKRLPPKPPYRVTSATSLEPPDSRDINLMVLTQNSESHSLVPEQQVVETP